MTLGFQFIVNALYAVDMFFFLSGFLVCYTVLGLLARKHATPWWQYYLHRYLRITPAYAYIMLIHIFVRLNFFVANLKPSSSLTACRAVAL
jgi:peptidoglycan/LPS O-acetylase OafA/YrhL